MHVRLADSSDLDALISFYHEVSDAMIGTPHDCCWRRGVHPSDAMLARMVGEGGMLVALDAGVLAGAAGIDHDLGHDYGSLPWLADVPPEEVAVIHLLAVGPAWRGSGLARELLDACVDEARRRGLRSVRLDVTDNNAPAQALYRSAGFAVVGSGVQDIGPEDRPLVRLEVMELVL